MLTNPKLEAVAFFYKYAGLSYDPQTETPEQGRLRGAEELAHAEACYMVAHLEGRATCVWSPDPEGFAFWKKEQREGRAHIGRPKKCEQADIIDADGNLLASLGGILDADENYRRVVRAELAAEAKL